MSETLSWPLALFLTFTCYGTWLPGDPRGSVFRNKLRGGSELIESSPILESIARRRLKNAPPHLGAPERTVVEVTIREVCHHRDWRLLALNVRTNHVHVVVYAESNPSKVMSDLKAWCTKRLVENGLVPRGHKVWTSGGSKRQLWKQDHVDAAVEYVVNGQGPDLPRAEP